MYKFYGTADMLQKYEESGWHRVNNGRGFRLTLPEELGRGYMEVWGDPESHCFIDSDMVIEKEMVERYYYTKRGLKVTFIEDMTGTYYQNKAQAGEARFGTFCTVCNMPQPWFHRSPAGTVQKCSSILVHESFLTKIGFAVPPNGWDRAAYIINGRDNRYPELAAICRDIKKVSVSDEYFPIYFQAKALETAALLFDIAFRLESKEDMIITHKTREAVKSAIMVLDKEFIQPPGVNDLAKAVGIDTKTLQKGFRQMVGQTPREYVRALRMEKALSYLEDQNLRMEGIARMTGYQSKVHFFNAFKTIYGCTPGQFSNYK